ncbi:MULTISPECIES: hypothetical protein [Tenacibaculum]|uniref:hypothetical protein n=1 Tax=Tenacibaculum TaxID=104267 RepID=UPI001F0B4959|nr:MULTISPECIES: hypothetical protein [Tenacibaculum]MCH3883265.1 hypothetical protein [Tenacibaculum aquimarinum]MDO6600379.1 hypothetical protein [Tenacibaculum sp. 1_MG-2023]
MEYKVIPFIASINRNKENSTQVAQQLEDIIKNQSNQGWVYVRLESVETFIQPDAGCFGLGAKPGYMASRQMLVFNKKV